MRAGDVTTDVQITKDYAVRRPVLVHNAPLVGVKGSKRTTLCWWGRAWFRGHFSIPNAGILSLRAVRPLYSTQESDWRSRA